MTPSAPQNTWAYYDTLAYPPSNGLGTEIPVYSNPRIMVKGKPMGAPFNYNKVSADLSYMFLHHLAFLYGGVSQGNPANLPKGKLGFVTPLALSVHPVGEQVWLEGFVHSQAAGVTLEFSSNGGVSWSPIASVLPEMQGKRRNFFTDYYANRRNEPSRCWSYLWTIPNTLTDKALVRVKTTVLGGEHVLRIAQPFTIVSNLTPAAPVLGAMTATTSAKDGEPITLTSPITGGLPPFSSMWEYSTDGTNWLTSSLIGKDLTITPEVTWSGRKFRVTVQNATGTAISSATTLQVGPGVVSPPVISTGPADQARPIGKSVTFAVAATTPANQPLSYQWYMNDTLLGGVTGPSLTFTVEGYHYSSTYSCAVTNASGTTKTRVAKLTQAPADAKFWWNTAPISVTAAIGSTAQFIVNVVRADSITSALNLQWHQNGVAIPGATGSVLTLASVSAADLGSYSCKASYTSVSGTLIEDSSPAVLLSLPAGPALATQPSSVSAVIGANIMLTAALANGETSTSTRWVRNGETIAGANGFTHSIAGIQPADAGIYQIVVGNATGTTYSEPAVVGVLPSGKMAGMVIAVDGVQNVAHPNGLVYDQHLLTGTAGTIRADTGQISRVSWIDPHGDIVQAEFSGNGAMTVVLTGATGPANPELYNQAIGYMKGTATVILAGADATTNMGIFSVGKATAVIPVNRLLALGYTQTQLTQAGVTTGVVPTDAVSVAMGGVGAVDTFVARGQFSALFKDGVSYDGWSDLDAVGISMADPAVGAMNTLTMGNVAFFGMDGAVGVIAPTLKSIGVLALHDIDAFDAAKPFLWFAPGGTVTANIRGGDLSQTNNEGVRVRGLQKVNLTAGSSSGSVVVGPNTIGGRLIKDGVDVTSSLVTGH